MKDAITVRNLQPSIGMLDVVTPRLGMGATDLLAKQTGGKAVYTLERRHAHGGQ